MKSLSRPVVEIHVHCHFVGEDRDADALRALAMSHQAFFTQVYRGAVTATDQMTLLAYFGDWANAHAYALALQELVHE